MNNMFSKAAIWVVIALVLFMVFKQFDNRSLATNAKSIAYSDFISEVKAGHIKDATIEDRTIVATTQDGTKVTVKVSGKGQVIAGGKITATAANGILEFTLDAGDVAEIVAQALEPVAAASTVAAPLPRIPAGLPAPIGIPASMPSSAWAKPASALPAAAPCPAPLPVGKPIRLTCMHYPLYCPKTPGAHPSL